MVKKNNKKLLSAISFAVSAAIFIFALAVFITSLNARSQNRPAVLFGYSFAVVVTDSMYPEIRAGDLIIVKSCDVAEMEVGQNAVFVGLDGTYAGKNIVHRVEEVGEILDDNGYVTGVYLVTKGINNPVADDSPVYASNFIGREVYHSTTLGSIAVFLKNPMNWLYMLVLAVTVTIIVTQLIRIIKTVIKKKQKQEENKEENQ